MVYLSPHHLLLVVLLSAFILLKVCLLSESGKLITWGSTDDLGQSYVTSGKHGVK